MATEPQDVDSTVSPSSAPATGELLLQFCAPIWGFPSQRAYVLRPAARDGIWWLQSTEADAVTFVVADPFVVDSAYAIDLGEKERAQLGLASADDALALVMLALPAAPGGVVTANFRAPIVINVRTGAALQVVNRDDAQDMQRTLNLAAYALRAEVRAEG